MKKYYLLLIFVMASVVTNAQFVNGGGNSNSKSSYGSSSARLYSSGNGAHFEGVFGTSLSFCSVGAGPSVDLELGCRVRDFFFVGAGTGLHTVFSNVDGLLSLPLYANIKGFLPIKENVMPFLSFSAGADFWWLPFSDISRIRNTTYVGFYTNVGLGVEWGRHQFSGGYELMGLHSGYFKYAITF